MCLIPVLATQMLFDSIKSGSCFLFKARLCGTGAKKSHCCHEPSIWLELFVQNHSVVFSQSKLERGAHSLELGDGCSGGHSRCVCVFVWLLSLWRKEKSVSIDLGWWSAWFYQRLGGAVMWKLIVLVGDSGSNLKVFRSKYVSVQPWSIINEPTRDTVDMWWCGSLKTNGGESRSFEIFWTEERQARNIWAETKHQETNNGARALGLWQRQREKLQRVRMELRGNGPNLSSPSCTPESKDLIKQTLTMERLRPLWGDCGRTAL